MIKVLLDEDNLLNILVDRVKFWESDGATIRLFEEYYLNMIEDGCFQDDEIDIINMVDDDYINNLTAFTDIDEAAALYGDNWDMHGIAVESVSNGLLVFKH